MFEKEIVVSLVVVDCHNIGYFGKRCVRVASMVSGKSMLCKCCEVVDDNFV